MPTEFMFGGLGDRDAYEHTGKWMPKEWISKALNWFEWRRMEYNGVILCYEIFCFA